MSETLLGLEQSTLAFHHKIGREEAAHEAYDAQTGTSYEQMLQHVRPKSPIASPDTNEWALAAILNPPVAVVFEFAQFLRFLPGSKLGR